MIDWLVRPIVWAVVWLFTWLFGEPLDPDNLE